jgi:hypothetical protein
MATREESTWICPTCGEEWFITRSYCKDCVSEAEDRAWHAREHVRTPSDECWICDTPAWRAFCAS